MKRLLALVAAAALTVLLVAVVNGALTRARVQGRPFMSSSVRRRMPSPTSASRVTPQAILLTFANEIFDGANIHKVGTDQGYCVRTEVGKSWECNYTTFLADGQITVEGPFFDAGDSTFAITGGTRAYRNARGSLELKVRSATEFDFIFSVIG